MTDTPECWPPLTHCRYLRLAASILSRRHPGLLQDLLPKPGVNKHIGRVCFDRAIFAIVSATSLSMATSRS